ncbi:ATP-binding protein [Streptomyces sp. AV19]|uniref:ATP-binding protein n=1 Tax=Streptomyces sp. AV19 TaxID=2793068 RepID=UPI0018FE4D3C|nr:ATP-binding protein [Streptomyces sp. AV19]MBH1939150.1 ATP-binding protein [Streptomyces sp. AV19]MDG4535284.1 ATP-binding protein [Streptomyces sp. AV19]
MHDDPRPVGGAALLARIRSILAARGLADTTPGPTDTTLTPDDPGHPDYHHRQRATVALARWETATPYRYRQATATHPGVIAWAQRAAVDIRDAGFLVLTGGIGTGKTDQAYGALRAIAEAGPPRFEFIATTAPDMYGSLRPGGSDKGTEYELRRLATVPLLLLDDLGTEKLSEWTEEATYRLINERYNQCLPLIVTTNLPIRTPHGEDRPDLAGRLGERLTSRLAEASTLLAFNGPDRRRQNRNAA